MGWWLSEWFKKLLFKIFIYYYYFFKTIRGVKEWEHGSLLPLTHSFYYFYYYLFIYFFHHLERGNQVSSLEAGFSFYFILLFNLIFLIYIYFYFVSYYLILNYLIFIYLLFIIFVFLINCYYFNYHLLITTFLVFF